MSSSQDPQQKEEEAFRNEWKGYDPGIFNNVWEGFGKKTLLGQKPVNKSSQNKENKIRTDKEKKIRAIIEKEKEVLPKFAVAARLDELCTQYGKHPKCFNDLTCRVLWNSFASGSEYVIFPLIFSDGKRWVARIPYDLDHFAKGGRRDLQDQIDLSLKSRNDPCSKIPLPWLHSWDSTGTHENNLLQRPYVFQDFVPGLSMLSKDFTAIPRNIWETKVVCPYTAMWASLNSLIYPQQVWIGKVLFDRNFDIVGILKCLTRPFPCEEVKTMSAVGAELARLGLRRIHDYPDIRQLAAFQELPLHETEPNIPEEGEEVAPDLSRDQRNRQPR